ncbi:LETM1-related biofilm-associated protein [uncultured Planktosalinus sp.]|uniref:LETM1-related biofilm-associated protein n=1 Tax=uncultured Planktosalinus sp. TaxID=1810935 RepID=UPI0030DA01A4
MNPSASGWIDKYIFILEKEKLTFSFENDNAFYKNLRKNGFIYGLSVETLVPIDTANLKLTEEEIAKVNTLQALMYLYFSHHKNLNYQNCITHLNQFYEKLSEKKSSLVPSMKFNLSESKKLEFVLKKRIEKTKSVDKSPFEQIVTNALLFLDILAYKIFLKNDKISPKSYAENLETILLQSCFLALHTKTQKTKYDKLLLEMFETSTLQHAYFPDSDFLIHKINFELLNDPLEKMYLIDLCTLAVWNDQKLEHTETEFLKQLCKKLNLHHNYAVLSFEMLKTFVIKHTTSVNLFQYTYPAKQFYNQSSKMVKLLILRNKNRLIKELSQSKELIKLLGKSTVKDLSTAEKTLIKEQLFDIFKSIPSLTIFLLPGGSLLLPLLIKFIPQLLPSAFDDNKIPKK